nr:site-specific integrase [uncultured Prevotella sp.]
MGKINLSIIHNRLKRGTAQKPVSVELRFTCGGKRKYISTGVKVCPSQWSDGSKHVIRCKDAEVFNKQIDAFVDRANEVIAKMIAKGSADLEEIPALMDGCSTKYANFIAYCEERTKQRKVSDHTKRRYKVFTDFLKKWGKIKEFSDVNVSNVRALDECLHSKGLEQSTVYCYHKYLKLFVRDACIDELVDKNPYNHLPFKIAKGDKEYVDCLPIDKFESIKRLHLEVDYLVKARDLFLMQCYTGLAYSDLMAFDFTECKERNGKYYYHGKRVKTDTDFTFQLLGSAVAILKKYNFHLPQISNQKYNEYLKAIGAIVGVPKLHSHMGRATAATLFLSFGMPLNIVAKVLGHTNIRQTQRYARTLNRDVYSAFDNIEGKI